jgi:hypothetical protein
LSKPVGALDPERLEELQRRTNAIHMLCWALASEEEPAKHDSQIISTDAGSSIEARPLPANAIRSIRDNFEFNSKEIETSDLQWEKHDSQITSTEAGR